MVGINKAALIIGMDKYDKSVLGPLPSCRKDAAEVSSLLRRQGYTIFPDNNPIIGSDFPSSEAAWKIMNSMIRQFIIKARNNQVLLLYFSGHGICTENNVYLTSANTDPEIIADAFSMNELISYLKTSPCTQIVCIIDACYSGASEINDRFVETKSADKFYNSISKHISDKEIHLLLSSRSYEESEAERKDNSIYTKYLLEGLEGKDQENGDELSSSLNDYGNVTPRTLHNYVYHRVASVTEERQHPVYVYRYEGESKIKIASYRERARRTPEIDARVERIKKLSDIDLYYQVFPDRSVHVREDSISTLMNDTKNWNRFPNESKKIILVTGVAGCGKSWFAHRLITNLFSKGHKILVIKGDALEKYPTGIDEIPPIFILDDRHIGFEGLAGGIPQALVCSVIQKCTQYDMAGPILISMRRDAWKMFVSGSIKGCNRLLQADEEEIVERMEIDLKDERSIEAADKVARSFYEIVDNNHPPYKFVLDREIRKKIIERSGYNLVVIKLFFEQLGRTEHENENYVITLDDVQTIIGYPIYYTLFQVFLHYSSDDVFENAEILAGLHFVAKSGHMSIGSLYNLWHDYYQDKSRPLPSQVYRYLLNQFIGGKPNEWPPALFDIDRYGSIISFHGSVDRTLIKVVENPAELISGLNKLENNSDLGVDERMREILRNKLLFVQNSLDIIIKRVEFFRQQYISDIQKWIKNDLDRWHELHSPQILQTYDPTVLDDLAVPKIPLLRAYYFLSMFKEFLEPQGKFDIDRYLDFEATFQSIFKTMDIESNDNNKEILATINRLLYHISERVEEGSILKSKGQLLYQLGAYDTDLDLILEEYFPEKDPLSEPLIENDYERLILFRRVGLALMTIGRLKDAEKLYDKGYELACKRREWIFDAAKVLQLRAELMIHQGRIEESAEAASSAILNYTEGLASYEMLPGYCSTGYEMWGVQNIAMNSIQLIICCIAYQAWILHLIGCQEYAGVTFREAEKLIRLLYQVKDHDEKIGPRRYRHIKDLWGIYYADYLVRRNDDDSLRLAIEVTTENMAYAKRNRLTEIISQSHRVMGDIEDRLGDAAKPNSSYDCKRHYKSSFEHYTLAVEFARRTTHTAVLIEALHGIALWYIKQGKQNKAIGYLEEAYGKLQNSKAYLFYRTDLEIALAKALLHNDRGKSKEYALRAYSTSNEIHYYWGYKQSSVLLAGKEKDY